jgi:hypothetical protein
MNIILIPLRFRKNTEVVDNANAFAVRLAKPHFDAVMLSIPSWHECEHPGHNVVYDYALSLAVDAGLDIIICRNLWDAWSDEASDEQTPLISAWYADAVKEARALATHVGAYKHCDAYAAINGEPEGGKCPQKWLRDNWDESKREAVSGAIREATFQSGRVHYVMPATAEVNSVKARYALSMAELGERWICWQTYRELPTDTGNGLFWPEPDYWAPPGHAARRDVRGLWVTHNPDGIVELRDGRKKQVLTVEQAMSCPEDTFWYSQDVPAVLEAVGR